MTAPTVTPTPAPKRARTVLPLTTAVLRKAKRADGHVTLLVASTAAPCMLAAEPCGGTAAWTWDTAAKCHRITLDPNYTDTVSRKARSAHSRRAYIAYGTAMIRHERWHGELTERDFAKIREEVALAAVPFSLLNIFEDARIEHGARVAEKVPFDWYRWNKLREETAHPAELFFDRIKREASTVYSPYRCRWSGAATVQRLRGGVAESATRTAEVIDAFYREVIAAPTTLDALALCVDWVATFPEAKTPEELGITSSGCGYSPNNTGAGKITAPTAYTGTFTTAEIGSLPTYELASLGGFLQGGTNCVTLSDDDFRDRFGCSAAVGADTERIAGYYELDTRRIANVAGRLARLLGAVDSPRQRLAQSGARVVPLNAVLGEPMAFRTPTATHGKRRIVAIFDQSGSMSHDWREHGAVFAAALQTLAQRGVVDVDIILTGGHRSAKVPRAFPARLFGRFACSEGCESIDRTLTKWKPNLLAADTVLIYTDGQLTDGDVNAGHWRSQGVDLIGCTVTPNTDYSAKIVRDALTKYFSRAIMAASGEELATAIVQYIVSH